MSRVARFTPRDCAVIIARLTAGISYRDLGDDLKCSPVTLVAIKKGTYKPNEKENARDDIRIQGDLFVDGPAA